ncbi:MAG TPA: PEP-CTERM sorting domain-containing protein [Myxococcota bacterium]|nr:PEP-CTERM sorting domain-containing protein [Myxococcota bacterium]
MDVGALGASGNATAEFSDQFTIMAPGLAGTTGTLTVAFGLASFVNVDGGVGSGCSGASQVGYGINASLTGGGHGQLIQSGTWTDYPCFGTHTFTGTPPGSFSFTGTVFFGAPAGLTVILSANSNESWLDTFSGAATAEGDFAHTLTWGGFTQVRDANGNLVTNYTLTSDSGTDWSKPVAVPEPATISLVATGLVALGARRRDRS